MVNNASFHALIVAAGQGARMEGTIPKQYRKLNGVRLLRLSVQTFLRHPSCNGIRIVIDPAHQAFYEEAVRGLELKAPIAGAATRQQSVRKGLEALTADSPEKILIHDAARPFVSAEIIDSLIGALQGHDAAMPVLSMTDRVRHSEGGPVAPREKLERVQTPQVFLFAKILAAHRETTMEWLDDASLAEASGMKVMTVPGSAANFKITTAEDLALAEKIAAGSAETRIGTGWDVHRTLRHAEKGTIRLAGTDIPSRFYLEGHSDADVVLHALTDAILGSISAGDIGEHFSPSDDKWKNADSKFFVRHALALLAENNGCLMHVDITLLCEEPKISPHRNVMRESLSELLDLPMSRISIKATTTEKLGFCGRSEGIACHATCTVRLTA